MPVCRPILLPLLFALSLLAQSDPPPIYGVYNEATRLTPAVAPGSVILIYSGAFPIGPEAPQTSSAFPLVTSLAGVSVRITVEGTSVDAFILGAESRWVRALVPSRTPAGAGRLVVSYGGRSSSPYLITIVRRQFALYDGQYEPPAYLAPSFRLPRLVQNLDPNTGAVPNSLLDPARPGQLVVLWGTGLGAAPGDEASGPLPGDLAIPGLQVLAGGRSAPVLYAGRSGCCAGMDVVIFEVPPGVEGCNVPVWVRFPAEGAASSDLPVSIASFPGPCSDPRGLSSSEVARLAAGTLTAAQISAQQDENSAAWTAVFGLAAANSSPAFGSCRVSTWGSPFLTALPPSAYANAGPSLRITSPAGTSLDAARSDANLYTARSPSPILPGEYGLDNRGGGPAAPPFHATLSIPAYTFSWTNRDAITDIDPAAGITVHWTADVPASGAVVVSGSFSIDGETCGGCGFVCYQYPEKGSFTIPPAILERAAAARSAPNQLDLTVSYLFSRRIDIPGFDLAEFVFFRPRQEDSTLIELK